MVESEVFLSTKREISATDAAEAERTTFPQAGAERQATDFAVGGLGLLSLTAEGSAHTLKNAQSFQTPAAC